MSKTIVSTGALLVGQTTREKSLTHRLPRGVFARDDEGNFQIADGVTPGGHNPLRRSVSIADTLTYVDIHVNWLGVMYLTNVTRPNLTYGISYTDTLSGAKTAEFTRKGNTIFLVRPDQLDVNAPFTLFAMVEGTTIDIRTAVYSNIMDDYQFQNNPVSQVSYRQELPLTLPADALSVSRFKLRQNSLSGFTKKNNLVTGAFWVNKDEYLPSSGTTDQLIEVPLALSAGKLAVFGDHDSYEDANVRRVILSYDESNYADAYVYLYDLDGNLLETHPLGNALSSIRQANSLPGNLEIGLIYSSLGAFHFAIGRYAFVVSISKLGMFASGNTTVAVSTGNYTTGGNTHRNYVAQGTLGVAFKSNTGPINARFFSGTTNQLTDKSRISLIPYDVHFSVEPNGTSAVKMPLYGTKITSYSASTTELTITKQSEGNVVVTKTYQEIFDELGIPTVYSAVTLQTLETLPDSMAALTLRATIEGKDVLFRIIMVGTLPLSSIPVNVDEAELIEAAALVAEGSTIFNFPIHVTGQHKVLFLNPTNNNIVVSTLV